MILLLLLLLSINIIEHITIIIIIISSIIIIKVLQTESMYDFGNTFRILKISKLTLKLCVKKTLTWNEMKGAVDGVHVRTLLIVIMK